MKKTSTPLFDADQIPFISIQQLKPYKNNPRIHSDEQIARLVGSIQEFGWTRPIICDEKLTILAGHGCFEAAKAMGADRVPVIIKSGLSAKQKRAYVIADNKLAERSTWNLELMRQELTLIKGIDLELLGLTKLDLKLIMDIDGAFPEMSASKGEYQTRNFVLHDKQAEIVDQAVAEAKKEAGAPDINKNQSGNAIAEICRQWLAQRKS